MKGYYSSIKQYYWIVLVCALLASAVGFFITKSEPTSFRASSILLVEAGALGTGATSLNTYVDPAKSVTEATNYAAEIQTHKVMDFVYSTTPEISHRGYTANYLLANVTATPSTLAATITVTASSPVSQDSLFLANSVTTGFETYIQQQNQQRIGTLRTSLLQQISKYQKLNNALEKTILTMGAVNIADPRYGVYTDDRNENYRTIDTLQSQLALLPETVKGDVSVVQKATDRDVTSSGKAASTIAAAGGIGILLGAIVILLIIALDNPLRGDEQVKEKLGLAYLGSISESKEFVDAPKMYTDTTTHEITDICVNLSLTGVLPAEQRTSQGATLLVTSAQTAEGKTTIAAGLARMLARSGSSVLVVEGNLHQPAAHIAFNTEMNVLGLSDLLQGASEEQINAAVQQTNTPNVWLLPRGKLTNASALLLKQKFPHILRHLRKRVDFIIIDGPAVLSGADATVLASMADGVVLVVDARHSKLPVLLRAKEVLYSLSHISTGVVINHILSKRSGRYYASAFPKDNSVTLKELTQQATSNGTNRDDADSKARFEYPIMPLAPSSPGISDRLNIPSSNTKNSIFS